MSRPTRPAAPSRCPTLVFAEPTRSGAPAGRPAPSAAPRAAASTGSPTGVPVPCSSTYWTDSTVVPARACASRITASWAPRSGTVSPREAPSLLTALPRITQCTRSPSARARSRVLRTTATPPSPRTYPLARASKVKHRPSGDSAPKRALSALLCGDSTRLAAPTIARSDSPERRLSPARCTATRDDDWAVSTVRLGPVTPSTYDSRLARMPRCRPVTACRSAAASPRRWWRAA